MFSSDTKILVVDDMPLFRTMTKNALRDLGFLNYTEAADGAAAWDLLAAAEQKKEPFQLVISDWSMPKMKGIELLKKVRAEAWGKSFPFIMLTGEAEKEFIIEAMQNKVSQYIIKPFTPAILKEKLEMTHAKWKLEHTQKAS